MFLVDLVHKKLGNVIKYAGKIKNVKAKNIINKHANHVQKKLNQSKEILICRSCHSIGKSITFSIGSKIIDYYLYVEYY